MATGTCQYSYSPPHVPCPHPPLGSGRLCLFHDQDVKSAGNFWKGIQEKLEKEDFDFEGYYFPPGPTADFRNRKFKDANFCNAIFKVTVVFYEAEFSGKTSFEGAEFPARTNFAKAKFLGDTNFNIAKFLGNTDFRWAEFSGVTNFKVAKFLGECTNTNFEWAKFSGITYFVKVEFSGEVVFHSVWLGNCRFYDTDLRRVKFIHCYFASQEGYRPIHWIRQSLNISSKTPYSTGSMADKLDEKIAGWTKRTDVLRDEIDTDEKKGKGLKDYSLIARSYQQLKKYFQEEEKDYARAGEFFYGEMECKRKAGLHRPFLHLYWAFSGYGERYLRALLWLLFYIFILFPFLYYFTYNNAYVTKFDYDELRECYLYSLNVITLRGTEATQSFPFRLCSTLEMIFGLIQSALFFMALRSKLRR